MKALLRDKRLPVLVTAILFIAMFAGGASRYQNQNFLSVQVIANLFIDNGYLLVAAIGATFVILTGGIDLSVGSTIGASGVAGAWIITGTGSLVAGVAMGLATGTAIGLVVGVVVARLNVVPFAVTLAALYVVSGCTTMLSHGRTLAPMPTNFIRFSIEGPGNIPYSVWLAIVLYVVAQTVLTRTAWGRRVLHVGANVEVARISGVNVARTRTSVYAVAGLFSAIAGMVLTSGLAGAGASMGSPLLLNIVGAVVLGGTGLSGGRGSLLRTGIGVLFLGFLSNGMSLLGLQDFDQQMVTGSFIFLAAAADNPISLFGKRIAWFRKTRSTHSGKRR
jgi:ribose transport system permease protein